MLGMDQLSEAMIRASGNRSRLIFIDQFQAKNSDVVEYKSLDMNCLLSEQLINVPKQDRPKVIAQMVADLINAVDSEVVLLIGLEILFDRSLAVDPIRLLVACAKNKTLLVCWPGDKTSSGLSYASPSHPEYRTYKTSDLSDVIFLTADAQLHRGI